MIKNSKQHSEYVVPGAFVWLLTSEIAYILSVEGNTAEALVRNRVGKWSDLATSIQNDFFAINGYPPHEIVARYHEELVAQGKLSKDSTTQVRRVAISPENVVEQTIALFP